MLTALAQALVLQKPAAVAEMENTKAGQVRWTRVCVMYEPVCKGGRECSSFLVV